MVLRNEAVNFILFVKNSCPCLKLNIKREIIPISMSLTTKKLLRYTNLCCNKNIVDFQKTTYYLLKNSTVSWCHSSNARIRR